MPFIGAQKIFSAAFLSDDPSEVMLCYVVVVGVRLGEV